MPSTSDTPNDDSNITTPHPHDVLCGRGGGTNAHPGNIAWRALVAENQAHYLTLNNRHKRLLCQSIVAAIGSQSPPGRFLSQTNGLWRPVSEKKALEKTSQALREGAPQRRQQQQKGNGNLPAAANALSPQVSTQLQSPQVSTQLLPQVSTTLLPNDFDSFVPPPSTAVYFENSWGTDELALAPLDHPTAHGTPSRVSTEAAYLGNGGNPSLAQDPSLYQQQQQNVYQDQSWQQDPPTEPTFAATTQASLPPSEPVYVNNQTAPYPAEASVPHVYPQPQDEPPMVTPVEPPMPPLQQIWEEPLKSHDSSIVSQDAADPPSSFQNFSDYSYGSITMTDAEQRKLESERHPPTIPEDSQFEKQDIEQQQQQQDMPTPLHGIDTGISMSLGSVAETHLKGGFSDMSLVTPADLDAIGLSLGSMSIGTNQSRMESISSRMEVPPRFEEAKTDCEGTVYPDAKPEPLWGGNKASTGNLMDGDSGSDEDETDDFVKVISGWEQMRANVK